jgi:hypothetical protein
MNVDSTGSHKFTTHRQATFPDLLFTFTFKQGTGEVSVSCQSQFTGSSYDTDHKLTSSVNTSIDEQKQPGKPYHVALSQNYPNPFNPSTTIEYMMPKSGHVTLRVYDILGREVLTLLDGMQEAGAHQVTLNMERVGAPGANPATGVYFYRMSVGGAVGTKKLVYLR